MLIESDGAEGPAPTEKHHEDGLGGLRGPLALGPLVLSVLVAVRAVRPVVDPILLAICAALVAVSVGVWFGHRIAGVLMLVFPVALVVSPAAADLSFSLVATDSSWWRWHAIASLLAGGVTVVVGIVVAIGRRLPTLAHGVALIGGLFVGVAMIGLVQLAEPTEVFGEDLTARERAALPRVDLLNYAYSPRDLVVDADGIYRALLVNPSSLPHTVSVDAIGLDLRVPAGREAVVEIDGSRLTPGVVEYYCSVGDHREIGMVGDLIVE